MNIVVTGATSFLGAALCKELVSRGHQVYAVVRPGSNNRQVLKKLENDSHFHIIFRNLEELDQLNRRFLWSVRCISILAGTDLEVRTGKIQRCRGKMHWTA